MLAYLEVAVISMVIFMALASVVMLLAALGRRERSERRWHLRLAGVLAQLGFGTAAVLALAYLVLS